MKAMSSIILRVALVCATGLLFTGCVGVAAKPVSPSRVEYGHRVHPAEAEFIRPGVTTRAEVTARLGTNYTALPKQRAIAYSWEMAGGGGVWWWVIATPYGGGGGAGSWTGGWRAIFVAFDEGGTVKAVAFKRPSTRRSLHEHLYTWVGKLPAAKDSLPEGLLDTKGTTMLTQTTPEHGGAPDSLR